MVCLREEVYRGAFTAGFYPFQKKHEIHTHLPNCVLQAETKYLRSDKIVWAVEEQISTNFLRMLALYILSVWYKCHTCTTAY